MKHHHVAVLFLAVTLIVCAFYAQGTQMMEPFKGKGKGKGTLRFNGSYPSAPVVCLAGNSKIPCTAFSSA
jgi:hypothetical protein